MLNEEAGELTQAYVARAAQARDEGRTGAELEQDFRSELADVLAQVLLITRRFDVALTRRGRSQVGSSPSSRWRSRT